MAEVEQEEVFLKLFDSFWFEHQIFKRKTQTFSDSATNTSLVEEEVEFEEPSPALPNSARNPISGEAQLEFEVPPPLKLSRIQTLHVRSLSDQFLSFKGSNFISDSESPNSVLMVPKLQTIISGKEVEDGGLSDPVVKQEDDVKLGVRNKEVVGGDSRRIRRRKRKGVSGSRSLSELEFEELKGFMDLGFVFSEQDKDSSLAEIIPGLQRLGKEKVDDDSYGGGNGEDDGSAARPYLSEAWDVLDKQKKAEKPLMNLKVPSFGNEMEMKDQLKFWAHSVASAVR